jgi:hypothetical protein
VARVIVCEVFITAFRFGHVDLEEGDTEDHEVESNATDEKPNATYSVDVCREPVITVCLT